MANLFDTINQNLSQTAAAPTPLTDETQRTQRLLRAKSGRAVSDSEAGISNLQEQSAVDNSNAQLSQLRPQVQLQQEQLGLKQQQQAQGAQQQQAQLAQANKFNNLQTKMQTASLLNQLNRDKATLDLDKDKSRLEQASFLLAMQNKKYVDDLQMYGQKKRLDNDVAFKQEMQNTAFGSNLDLLKDKIGSDDIMAANDRQFKQAINQLTMEDAEKVAANEMQHANNMARIKEDAVRNNATIAANAANTQAKYQGYGQILSGGIGAVGAYSNMPDSKPTPDKKSEA